MKWTHTTGLLATLGLISAGGIWAGCSNGDNTTDGGTDSGTRGDTNAPDTGKPGDGGNPSDASDGGGVFPVDGSVLDCNYYCTNIALVCTGSNNQYKDNATCMSMCTNGIPDDAGAGATAGDSLACRMYHLSVAATSTANAAIHCPHTGPYGYGMCGGLCEDFCHQYFTSVCSTDTVNGYVTADACRNYCATAAGADAAAGAPGNSAGSPSMLCREYHLENAVAAGNNDAGHCDHAGLLGGGVCN